MTMNFTFNQARINMVKNKIRPWEVLDPEVLNVLEHVHREEMVTGSGFFTACLASLMQKRAPCSYKSWIGL